MEAHIYLHPANFAYNGSDDLASVQNKFHALLSDMKKIVYSPPYNQENKFVVQKNMHEVKVFAKKDLYTFMEENISVDDKTVFWTILSNTADGIHGNALTIEELSAKCVYYMDEEHPTTMMIVNALPAIGECQQRQYMQFDNYQIVYGYNSWQTFRRQILGNHPGSDANKFMEECNRYFPNLSFHPNCVSSLNDGSYNYLETCPRKIVYYLSALNDDYFNVHKQHHQNGGNVQPNDILVDFSGMCGLEEPGSIHANPATKDRRTFVFVIGEEKVERTILCDLHLKISLPDDRYNRAVGKDFNPRIYFNIEMIDENHAGIYVGSIGKHL